ncbi:protein O-GlcNAc transferase [Paraburkholderia sp. GAS41]|uniref:tetratricopeptide repeat protein n=1 Tax=Paraburkholderia sp. GAS41 TaxID=3035134 RepID=UPI003D20E3FB
MNTSDDNSYPIESPVEYVPYTEATTPLVEGSVEAGRPVSLSLRLAWKNHEAGQLAAAEALYKSILAADPDHIDALRSLGVLAHSNRDFDEAIKLLRRVLSLDPSNAQAHVNLADVFKAKGEPELAAESYREAIAHNPQFESAYNRLGGMLLNRHKFEAAAEVYEDLLKFKLENPDAYHNLALANAGQGELDKGIELYERAIALEPDHLGSHINLANALVTKGELQKAVESCHRAISINDEFHPAYITLGNAQLALGNTDEAIEAYRHSIKLQPRVMLGYSNLASALSTVGRFDEAIEFLTRAIELAPTHFSTYDVLLFLQHYNEHCTPQQNMAFARRYGDAVMAGVTPFLHGVTDPACALRRPLRIGFVSGDLKAHPVGYFLENVLANLDPKRVELVAYSLTHSEDAITERIKPYFSDWKSLLDLTPKQSAQIIHDDHIDILLDMSGHTAKSGLPLFAWKPAPIQANWIGYFATTGVPTMDYIMGDIHTLPVGEEDHFGEKPWRLPDGYLCFKPPAEDVSPSMPPMMAGKPATFGCFNKLSKMTDTVVALWARILKAVPDSRLMLKNHELSMEANRQRTLRRFAVHGIGEDQILLEGPTARVDYFEKYNQIDVALDPFPYNGGTTTVEALWMGVPVIAKHGDRFVAHMSEGILHHLGHPEWIAADEDDYVAKAVSLVNDPVRLAEVRLALREELLASPLCDAPRFAKKLEDEFAKMWQLHCEQALSDPSSKIDAKLEAAIELQRAERFDESEHLYREILQVQPNHPGANQNLGVLAIQKGKLEASLPYFKTSLEASPKQEELWAIYIEALVAAGKHEAAREALQLGRHYGVPLHGITIPAAVTHDPESQQREVLAAEFEATLVALRNGGSIETERALAEQMTQVLPERGFGWKALADTFIRQGRFTDAWQPLSTAAELLPDDRDIRRALGQVVALQQTKHLAQSVLKQGDFAAVKELVMQLHAAGWVDAEVDALALACCVGVDVAEAQ